MGFCCCLLRRRRARTSATITTISSRAHTTTTMGRPAERTNLEPTEACAPSTTTEAVGEEVGVMLGPGVWDGLSLSAGESDGAGVVLALMVTDAVADSLIGGVSEGDVVGVADAVTDADGVRDTLAVSLRDDVTDALAVSDTDCVTDDVGVRVSVAVGVREIVGVTEGVSETVGVREGVTEIVGVFDGETEMLGVLEGVTDLLEVLDGVTDMVGVTVLDTDTLAVRETDAVSEVDADGQAALGSYTANFKRLPCAYDTPTLFDKPMSVLKELSLVPSVLTVNAAPLSSLPVARRTDVAPRPMYEMHGTGATTDMNMRADAAASTTIAAAHVAPVASFARMYFTRPFEAS